MGGIMRIAVLTLYTPNISNYADITTSIHEQYCEHNDYTYIKYTDTLDASRPPSWSKILALKNNMDDFDWILWIDADTLINNHDIRIESLIDENYNIVMCGDTTFVLNCGVMLIKCCKENKLFLDKIYNMTQFINSGIWEQEAIITYYKRHRQQFKLIPQQKLNSYMNNINQDGFIMHFPGSYRGYMMDVLQMYLNGDFSAGKLRYIHFKNKLQLNINNNKPWYFEIEDNWWHGMNEEQFLDKVSNDKFRI